MKATSYTKMKRLLALILTICMVMGCMSLEALAAVGETESAVTGSSSIASAVYLYDATQNKLILNEATPADYTSGDDDYSLSKTIKNISGKANEYEITLKVETKSQVQTTYSKSATVLVIDISNSMNDGNRILDAKNAAKAFLKEYSGTDSSATQKLAVVFFGTEAETKLGWTNIAGAITTDHNENVVVNSGSANKANGTLAINAIDGIATPSDSKKGGTNLEYGLSVAKTLLDSDSLDSTYLKSVVVLTDGVPTYRGTSGGYEYTGGFNGYYKWTGGGTGKAGSADNNNAAKTVASAMKNDGVTVYTVCLGAAEDSCYDAPVDKCKNCDKPAAGHYYSNRYCEYKSREKDYGRLSKKFEAKTEPVLCGDFLRNDIASAATSTKTYAYNSSADDAAALASAFTAIGGDIVESGQSGAGTQVIDPAPAYLTIDTSSLSGAAAGNYNAGSEGITWNLAIGDATKSETTDPNTNITTTTYTYTLKYNITVDPDSRDAVEGINPTNGRTYLNIPATGDTPARTLDFKVPAVNIVRSSLPWTIKYYLQGGAEEADYDNYELQDFTKSGFRKLYAELKLAEVDSEYESRYTSSGYTFETASSNSTIVIGKTATENVINVYYKHTPVEYTVRTHYTVSGTYANGTPVDVTVNDDTPSVNTGYINQVIKESDIASATKEKDGYTFTLDPKNTKLTLTATGENVIDLYYVCDIEEASLIVEHKYYSKHWTQNEETGLFEQDSEYKLDATLYPNSEDITKASAKTINGWASGQKYALVDTEMNQIAGYGDYDADIDNAEEVALVAGVNTVTLNFYYDEAEPQKYPVTVIRHFTKSVTTIDSSTGNPGTVVYPNDEKVTEDAVQMHAGEPFTASETENNRTYEGDLYPTLHTESERTITVSKTAENKIDLYYTITEVPDSGKVTVNHRYYKLVTTSSEGIETTEKDLASSSLNNVDGNVIYLGQRYSEAPVLSGSYSSYKVEEVRVDGSKIAYTNGSITGNAGVNTVIDIDYIMDDRAETTVTVIHQYFTKLDTVIGGEVFSGENAYVRQDRPDFSETEEGLRAGDSYTAVERLSNGTYTYERVTANKDLKIDSLKTGGNTIIIRYERTDSDLVPVDYTVNYIYKTYYQYKVNGEVVTVEAEDKRVTLDPVTGSGYIDQKIDLDPKTDAENYPFTEQTNSTEQVLKSDNHEWTFIYKKVVPQNVTVTEKHIYTTTLETVENNEVVTKITEDHEVHRDYEPRTDLKGTEFTVEAQTGDYIFESVVVKTADYTANDSHDVTFTANADIEVIYNYIKRPSDLKKTDVTVQHIYETYYWDDENFEHPIEALTKASEVQTHENWVVGTPFKQATSFNAPYEFYKETNNDTVITDFENPVAQQIIVEEGGNALVLYYRCKQPAQPVSYTVNHYYYEDQATLEKALAGDETAAAREIRQAETFSGTDGEAAPAPEEKLTGPDSGLPYTWVKTDPETLIVSRNGGNAINLYYVRATAEYTVKHQYYCNDVFENITVTDDPITAKIGDTINVSEDTQVGKKPVNGNNNYTFNTSESTQSIIISGTEENIITLRYDRYTVNVSEEHNYHTYLDDEEVLAEKDKRESSSTLVKGASYTASVITKDTKDNDYTCVLQPSELFVEHVLNNREFKFEYERRFYTVTVTHNYKTIIDHVEQPVVTISEQVKADNEIRRFVNGDEYIASPVCDRSNGTEMPFTCLTKEENLKATIDNGPATIVIDYVREFHNAVKLDVEHHYVTYINDEMVEDFTLPEEITPVCNKNEEYTAPIKETVDNLEFTCISTKDDITVKKVQGGEHITVEYVRYLYDYSITYFDGYTADAQGVDDAENGRIAETSKTFGVDENGKIGSGETFTRSGYTFLGWSTEEGASEVEYAAGSSITLPLVITIEEDDEATEGELTLNSVAEEKIYHLDLYAVWEKTTSVGGSKPPKTEDPVDDPIEEPIEIEEPETPLADAPVEIEEPEVPLADQTGEEVLSDFFEEDVPLADVPSTGDGMLDIVIIMVASAVILLGYALLSRLEGKKNK